ncbi:unnamed protein product [Callosobruchus maculatus]|uniref:Reverse transcriptase domain-containing protein n=1 Tax=Callosobruchus maculatus TaxID=64391 RepID=A0A653BYC2_CALMS|nr:unnamed protein product [Callosobruchus maculatus]
MYQDPITYRYPNFSTIHAVVTEITRLEKRKQTDRPTDRPTEMKRSGNNTYKEVSRWLSNCRNGGSPHIVESPSVKLLGININNNMSWHDHVVIIAKTASQKLGVLFHCGKLYELEQLLLLYKEQIRPSLEYSSHVRGCALKYSPKLLDTIQKRGIRLMDTPNLTKDLHSLEIKKGWLTCPCFTDSISEDSRLAGFIGWQISQAQAGFVKGRDREHGNHREIKTIGRCEVVQCFVYLGSLIDNSGSCENEIRRRIQQARVAMTELTKIWRDHNITKATKMLLVQSLVFSIFSYASETWTIKKADRARIDAFEMWTWRRMLRIPYTAHRTNVSILDKLGNPKRLSSIVSMRMLTFFGHIHRSDNMEKHVIQGHAPSGRRRGRSPTG